MFDTLATRIVQPKSVEWKAPEVLTLDLNNEEGPRDYRLLKGAVDYLHNAVSLKVATSKEVYKKSNEIWKQLIKSQLEEVKDTPNESQSFYLDKKTMVYLINENKEIVDICDLVFEDDVEEFKIKHQQFILELTTINYTRKFFAEHKNGLVKLVCYDKKYDNIAEEKYIPIVILELNNNKSLYNICTGILIYDGFTFVPSISYDTSDKSLVSFVKWFNIDNLLNFALDRAEEIYNNYNMFLKNPEEISVREMTNLCHKVGYKLELDNEAKLAKIDSVDDEENNLKIQDFYNSFKELTGETTYEILKLSDLRKAFRYNKLTLLDMLSILSKEYLAYSGSKITAEILGDIVFKLLNKSSIDKSQVEDVKRDVAE